MRTSFFFSTKRLLTIFLLFLVAGSVHAMAWGLPYLLEIADPAVRGAGNVSAVPPTGVSALGSNPASLLNGEQARFRVTTLSVPDMRVQVLARDELGGYRTEYRLMEPGYSLAIFRKTLRAGERTRLAAEVAFRGAGRFIRVDQDGTSIHAFPETDWLVGLAYSAQLTPQFTAGATARWLRSKYTEPENLARYGHGWAFDVGFRYRPAERWRVGLAVRNLSRGVSFPDFDRPRRPHREVVLGAGHRLSLSARLGLDLAADVRFPSKRGVQASVGATLSIDRRIALRAGYLRRVERWRATRLDLSTGETATDERLWTAEGPTFGLSVDLGGWELSTAVSPRFRPSIGESESRTDETSRWLWSFGMTLLR